MLLDSPLTIAALLKTFWRPISLTWLLTLCETALMALIPLLIGFAIDGLLESNTKPLFELSMVMTALIVVSVIRRIYDTRAYGTIKVQLCEAINARSGGMPVSTLNARLDMGRELVDFLEIEVPELMNSLVQLVISVIVLFSFHAGLSGSAMAAGSLTIFIYLLFHKRFFNLNAGLNHQKEQQVVTLETRRPEKLLSHLMRMRRAEVKISDTESYVYGAIFLVLMGFIVFNLWFSVGNLETSAGTIFSIVSYSWEFVESCIVLPMTLQSWSRLSEIVHRINSDQVVIPSA